MIERVKNNKILLGLAIGIMAVAFLLVFRIAYAYLAANFNSARRNVVANSEAVDEFKFIEGDPLSIAVTPTTLPENGDNLVITSKPIVSLKANESTETAKYNYYIYLNITTNTFVYTKTDKTPEILLSVTKPNGDEVTNIKGLEYTTVYGASGFDVTEYTGMIKIASNELITSDSSSNATEHEWTISLIYINFEVDQSINYGSKLNTEIHLTKESKLSETEQTLANYIQGLYTEDGENNLYYHDGTGEYENSSLEAGDFSYRYSGASGDVNNYICFKDINQKCSDDELYRIIGLFPTDETNEEYQAKLIKNTTIGNNYWSGSTTNQSNSWADSTLQTDILNNTKEPFWRSLGIYSDKIVEHDWVVSGVPDIGMRYTSNAQIGYNYEIGTCDECEGKQEKVVYSAKVGLMYLSDYYYAASAQYWSFPGYTTSTYKNANNQYGAAYDYRAAISSDWLFISGSHQWTITPIKLTTANAANTTQAYYIYNTGYPNIANVYGGNYVIRPTLYLNSDVKYVSGSGTAADPLRIA